MNNGYYNPNNMGFEQVPNIPSGNNDLPMEQSYVENILRLNKGKIASFYMSYPDSMNGEIKYLQEELNKPQETM